LPGISATALRGAKFVRYPAEIIQLRPQCLAQRLTGHETTTAPEALTIRVRGMRADAYAIFERFPYCRLDTCGIPGVTAAGNIAARDYLQQLRVVRIAFAEICVEIDGRHLFLSPLRCRFPDRIDL
jgi:hypothetical protein